MEQASADNVKSKLYGRHPGSAGQMPGPWTVIEEYRGIDVLAFSAWHSVGRYARVGYEVKVSRSDFRRELLRPMKRAGAVEWCNEFYFAVPAGLLTDEELAFDEPEEFRQLEAFSRVACPARCVRQRGERQMGREEKYELQPDDPEYVEGREWLNRRYRWIVCDTCGGRGYIGESLVERAAPTLWIPADVGLVLVDGRGTTVARRSPRRKEVPVVESMELGKMVRWISMRPDPRHHPRRASEVAAA